MTLFRPGVREKPTPVDPDGLLCALRGLCVKPAGRTRQHRRGISLVEVMVVIAILLALAVILFPAVSAALSLDQQKFAKNLAIEYELLHDEAVLRNVTFRVAYYVDACKYTIEVGDPDVLIFDDPQKRADYEEKVAGRMRLLTDREESAQSEGPSFSELQTTFDTTVECPSGTAIKGVYTPQYGELMGASGDPENPTIIYSYIFPNGFSERTIVQITDDDDPSDGFTVEVQSLSGAVTLHNEVVDIDDLESNIPDVAPELP